MVQPSEPGPTASYVIIVEMILERDFSAVWYYGWGTCDTNRTERTLKDAQFLDVYYSDDAVAWDNTDVVIYIYIYKHTYT